MKPVWLGSVGSGPLPSRKFGLGLLALVLWAGTSALAFVEILTVREIALRIYAHFAATGGFYGRDYWGGVTLNQLLVWPLAILWIAVVIGGGEYHYKYFGQPRSWKVFGWMISIELTILVLALFV